MKPEERFARMLEVESASTAIAGSDASVAPMVMLASALRTAGVAATPTPLAADVRAAMRQRLVAVATVQTQDAAADRLRQRNYTRVSTRMQRRAAALAGSVTLFTGLAGVGVAAAHSLPGDPFYGVKRATESVQLWIAQGNDGKGARHLEFARERLEEARALPANSSHLASTLAAMDSETTDARNDLVAAYHSSESTKPLAQLASFAQQQYAGLVALSKTAPASLHAAEVTSLGVLGTVTTTVRSLSGEACLPCLVNGTAPVPPSGGSSTPNGGGGTSPSTAPSTQPQVTRSPQHTPSSHPTAPSTTQPTHTPTSILPTIHLPLPTLSPGHLLHQLLGGKTTQKQNTEDSPTPLVSSLLKSLGL